MTQISHPGRLASYFRFPLVPNFGSSFFDGGGFLVDSLGTFSPDDQDKYFVAFWIYPTNISGSQAVYTEIGGFGSGKFVFNSIIVRFQQTNTGAMRVTGNDTSENTNLDGTTSTTGDANEWNMWAFSIDVASSTYQYLHWSDTSGKTVSTISPSTDTGNSFARSLMDVADVARDVTNQNQFVGRIAQIHVRPGETFDLSDSNVQNKIIREDRYMDFRTLTPNEINLSGQPGDIEFNNSPGGRFPEWDFAGNGATAAAGPQPPFSGA